MSRGPRAELERLVQDLERKHPDWSCSRMESELEILAPVSYGTWKDSTPVLRTRHRQVQRWRTGSSSAGKTAAPRLPYQYLWPVGEKQRHALDAEFEPRQTRLRASQRIFLHNCSGETLREIRVLLGGGEVAYEPALGPGRLTEIHWVKNERIRASALAAAGHQQLAHELAVEFAVAKGTKWARLAGSLTMDASDGWTSFASRDGPSKEIE